MAQFASVILANTVAELALVPTTDLVDGTFAFLIGTTDEDGGAGLGVNLDPSTYNAPTNVARPLYVLLKTSTQAPNGTTFVTTPDAAGVWARLSATFG